MSKFKIFFLLFFFTLNLYSIEVIVAKTKINYKEVISLEKLSKVEVSSVKKYCTPVTVKDFETTKYIAKHYIRKGSVICLKNIAKYKKSSVLFNFGSIEIERNGKVIFENNEYVKIKREDGKIEKIYKDGRLQ